MFLVLLGFMPDFDNGAKQPSLLTWDFITRNNSLASAIIHCLHADDDNLNVLASHRLKRESSTHHHDLQKEHDLVCSVPDDHTFKTRSWVGYQAAQCPEEADLQSYKCRLMIPCSTDLFQFNCSAVLSDDVKQTSQIHSVIRYNCFLEG